MEYFLIALSYIGLFLTVFWLQVVYLSSQRTIQRPSFPSVSIVIPAHNEEHTIADTLRSVLALHYPRKKIEILVVNDGSTDRTAEIVRTFPSVHLLSQPQAGKAAALNAGLRHCRNKLFVCLDADSTAQPDTLQRIVPHFADSSVGAVICAIKVHQPSLFLEKLQWFEYLMSAFARKLMARINVLFMTPGAFSVYRTGVLRTLGGFALNNLTEDFEMALRLHKHHYKVLIETDGVSYTVVPPTLRKLFKQRVRWYRGFIDNTLRYKEMLFNSNYGMLGSFQLPVAILSMFLTVLAVSFVGVRFLKQASLFLADFISMGLDYFRLYEFPSFSSFLRIDALLWFPTIIGLALVLFLFYKAHKTAHERFKYGPVFIVYVLYYSVLHVVSFLTALFKELFRTQRQW